MGEKLLINVAVEETRLALVEGGRIKNLEIDSARLEESKGNIYKAVVHRVNPSLQAAFVDYGAEKQGFLPVGEIHDRYYPEEVRGQRVPIQQILKNGQELMVQVVKDEIGNKGAALTTFVSIPGRYLVLMGQSTKTGISRRLPSDERQRLKRIIDNLPVPEGFGLIIRTAGVEREEDELAQDLAYLKRLWESLEERFRELKRPGLIHRERSIALRFLRDYASPDWEEILIDDDEVAEEVRNFATILLPELHRRVKVYDDPTPLFSRYQLEDQIEDIFARRIDLPSGGYLIIDQTEALVSVDVNSGRVKTDDIEQTALTTNLEAAAEVARQLRIRDLGGLIVIDFIDMRERANNRKVEEAARDAFADDKAKVKYTRISDFGLMEVSRQRLKTSLLRGSFIPCSHCGGTGMIRSTQSSALYILRRTKETVLRGAYIHASAKLPVELANYILNRKRRDLVELERQSHTTIEVHGAPDCPPNKAFLEVLTRPSHGKLPRRVLHTFDLVRSEVEKRDLAPDDDFLAQAAEARGVSFTSDELDEVYRKLDAEMAVDAKERLAKKEAARQSRLEREAADKKALEEAAERAREEARRELKEFVAQATRGAQLVEPVVMVRKGGLVGWFKRLLFGELEPVAKPISLEPPKSLPDKRSGGSRKPASSRVRSRNGGSRARAVKASGTARDARPERDTKSNKSDKSGQEGGAASGGSSKSSRRRRRRKPGSDGGDAQRGAAGGSATQSGGAKSQDATKPTADGAGGASRGGDAEPTAAGEGTSSAAKRRRRRRRKKPAGEGGQSGGDAQPSQSGDSGQPKQGGGDARAQGTGSKPPETKPQPTEPKPKPKLPPKRGGVIDLRGGGD